MVKGGGPLSFGVKALVFCVLLFGGAGTVRWLGGWVFLVEFLGAVSWLMTRLARRDPALFAERMKGPVQANQPWWDKALIIGFIVLYPLWLLGMALDAGRFHWSAPPAWTTPVGAVVLLLGFLLCDRALAANPFMATVVRIQSERNQQVVSRGPYEFVRHPFYLAGALVFVATPLVLGSAYGLLGSGVLLIGLIVRTVLEDRELRAHLDGYAEYAGRVRFRLVPHVW